MERRANMERIGRALRSLLKHLKDSRGVSLYEITAAVAMTGILAAVAVPVIIDKVQEAKAARTVQETDSIYKALSAFQRDTGKMPGEFEGIKVLITTTNGGSLTPLPDGAAAALSAPGVTIVGTTCTAGCANINDFLVRDPNVGPSAGKYQNWRGPYVDEVTTDPFDRSYAVNIQALYVAEPSGSQANSCGYGWVLSGGPNRALETTVRDTNFTSASDDIGKNNGKKQPPGLGCTSPAL
jgi:type II secretory pathway pseudopilin PulG